MKNTNETFKKITELISYIRNTNNINFLAIYKIPTLEKYPKIMFPT